ncbi:MAG: hypothetical protein U5N85_13360 [Arcicella sp.]|nr:hypothetical protein [Arcicella sp.]
MDFVRNDVYYNSRRNLDLRDGVLDVFPLDASNLPTRTGTALTANPNDDINAIPQLGYSAIVTRLGVRFGGVTAFGAKANGILETDFFGITNGAAGTSGGGTENLLRLRHAYVALDWEKRRYWLGNIGTQILFQNAFLELLISVRVFLSIPSHLFHKCV